MPPELRTAIYGFASATLTALVTLNIVTNDQANLLLNLIGQFIGLLGTVLAVIYRPTAKPLVQETPTPKLEEVVKERNTP